MGNRIFSPTPKLFAMDRTGLTTDHDGVRTLARMPVAKKDPLQPKRCAELLAALAAPERLKIVRFLAEATHNVTEIADMLAIGGMDRIRFLSRLRPARGPVRAVTFNGRSFLAIDLLAQVRIGEPLERPRQMPFIHPDDRQR